MVFRPSAAGSTAPVHDTASPEITRQASASFLGRPRLITLTGVNRRLEVIYERAAIILARRYEVQVHHFKSEAADPLPSPMRAS